MIARVELSRSLHVLTGVIQNVDCSTRQDLAGATIDLMVI